MHTCPDCGKAMATAGGLEIHVEMHHAAPVPEPAPEALAPPPPVAAVPAPAPSRRSAPILRGYDPTVPLTALLVVVMLMAGVGAAVHRSGNPPHRLAAAVTSDSDASSVDPTSPTTIARAPAGAPTPPAPSPAGSPAAIPPAGSQSPVAAQNSAPCQRVVASLSTRPSKRTVDIADLMRSNSFPALPLAGFEHPSVDGVTRYDTVQEFLDDTFDPGDPNAATYGARLQAAGFVGGETIDFTNAGTQYGALVLRFASATNAREFNKATLSDFCAQGIIQNLKAMPTLSGGMNYLMTEGGPPYRSTFVAGDSVVRLNLCHCVQAPDDQALAGQWAQAIAGQVGAA